MSQEQQQPLKKQRLIQVVVEDDDTKQTLMERVVRAAGKEMQYMEAKKTFLYKIVPHKESFERLKNDQVDTLMYYILKNSRVHLKLADKAKSARCEITVELNKYDKETKEYILETTDIYHPLQFFEGKKACLRELVKEVSDRVELLEEKNL